MRATAHPLRIVVIAPLRYPIREPHAGGLESSIWHQVDQLRARGHHVTLAAVEGSDFLDQSPESFVLPPVVWAADEVPNDVDYPVGYEDRALPALERALAHIAAHSDEFDVVHNHSLHGTPLAWAGRLGVPMVSTLHTPVLPQLVAAHASAVAPASRFIAVSAHTAGEWMPVGIESTVVPNAVDADRWPLGPGGPDLVWFGRIVEEKGAHLAIRAAKLLGRRIVLAGRIGDPRYFEQEVAPLLGPDAVYLGELRQPELAALVGRSRCALVTPVWQEPFGLIIAEAMMTGTPVACFDTGGVSEVVGDLPGTRLVAMGSVKQLAAAAEQLIARGDGDAGIRRRTRTEAVQRFSLGVRVLELETMYRRLMLDGTLGAALHAVPALPGSAGAGDSALPGSAGAVASALPVTAAAAAASPSPAARS
ncbi:glycosyltransferase family 4 protein [Subtercola sp. Z020]|nr:glycosyltransferase [Subtercola sp. Z020]PPF75347.1 glycosyltransferase family 4 protein [Subtercola sp. Z020]